MATLILDFVPPEIAAYNELQVWESSTKEGAPGTLIESFAVTAPYPTRITVTEAVGPTNWFSIRWAGPDSLFTEFSDPIQGGTSTLVGILINRVMLRQPNVNENIVKQITEAVLAEYFGTQEIYDIDPDTVGYNTLEGLTLFIMAQSLVSEISSTTTASTGDGWTAGLVSMKNTTDTATKTSTNWDNIERLLKLAEKWLGVNYSRISQMEIEIAGGMSQIVTADISRLLIEVE